MASKKISARLVVRADHAVVFPERFPAALKLQIALATGGTDVVAHNRAVSRVQLQ